MTVTVADSAAAIVAALARFRFEPQRASRWIWPIHTILPSSNIVTTAVASLGGAVLVVVFTPTTTLSRVLETGVGKARRGALVLADLDRIMKGWIHPVRQCSVPSVSPAAQVDLG
eukprot:CAMPEP_0113572386 /NCGR_PEP_ID=MMETSP0015_2-20120614/26061_1 /TAXON_ID=2838 /ORGANISM="Odontella" /LENGTH=114 /DNA_ID=CAMNT_0000475403 /DNA_START=1007 /DNA_END=1351 /DNA_ORIENTATION=+ /assembly_acc=CAM_ASM_000160